MATITYTNLNTTHTITILSTSPITIISTEFDEAIEFASALEAAQFFGLPVAEVRKALKG